MGYYIRALICHQLDTKVLTAQFDKAHKVSLAQELDLIPMTEELFDQINKYESSPNIATFEYLTENVERIILSSISNKKFAYVEAEYFGGNGGQTAIIWNKNKRAQLLSFGQDNINQVLRNFGVIAQKGQDEFLTLGFGLRRHTEEWLGSRP